MAEFGRRTGAATAGKPRAFASGAPRETTPASSDLISKGDLKTLEKGELPSWTTMSRAQLIGIGLFVIAMVMGAVGFYGPDVVRDLRNAGTYRVAHDLRATDGNCTRYAFLVTLCSAKIHTVGRAELPTTNHYLMFFRSGDGEQMVPVRSAADASAVGIQYAVSDILLNRTLSLLAVTIFFSWISWIFFTLVREGRYQGGRAHAAILQYVALHSSPASA
jgi:hypothetical protein